MYLSCFTSKYKYADFPKLVRAHHWFPQCDTISEQKWTRGKATNKEKSHGQRQHSNQNNKQTTTMSAVRQVIDTFFIPIDPKQGFCATPPDCTHLGDPRAGGN
jgi:hypothetical protein